MLTWGGGGGGPYIEGVRAKTRRLGFSKTLQETKKKKPVLKMPRPPSPPH